MGNVKCLESQLGSSLDTVKCIRTGPNSLDNDESAYRQSGYWKLSLLIEYKLPLTCPCLQVLLLHLQQVKLCL